MHALIQHAAADISTLADIISLAATLITPFSLPHCRRQLSLIFSHATDTAEPSHRVYAVRRLH
jgi:hypothetical protein